MAGLTISWTCQVVSLRWQTNWRAALLLCPRAREKRRPGKDDGSFSFHLVRRTNGVTSQGLLSQHKPLRVFYKYSCLLDISLQSYLHGIFHLSAACKFQANFSLTHIRMGDAWHSIRKSTLSALRVKRDQSVHKWLGFYSEYIFTTVGCDRWMFLWVNNWEIHLIY